MKETFFDLESQSYDLKLKKNKFWVGIEQEKSL